MIIYFVRHGESEGNRIGLHQTSEIPLSKDGIKQANALAKRFVGIHFDLIYSSDFLRARQTAEIINKKIKAPIMFREDLSEMRNPSEIRGKRIDDENVVRINTLIRKNAHKGNWKYSDEETFDELIERAGNVLKEIEEKHSNQTILVVSHSTAIKAIVGKIIFADELTPNILLNMKHHMWAQNTGITICEKHPKYGWQLNTWNDMTHL